MINEDAVNTKLSAQAPLYFECSVCGECCSSWNIPIEGEKARALLQKEWVGDRLASQRRELVRITEALYRLPLTDENVCVFLGEDRRCLIEVHEGSLLKPQECQRFPFAAVRLPDGSMRHDTSAACKQIAEKLLLAFQPILPRPDDAALPILEAAHEKMPVHLYKGLFRRIDGAGYAAYQQALREIFRQGDASPETLLQQVCRLLSCLPEPGKPAFPAAFAMAGWCHRWVPVVFLRKPYGTWTWFSLIRGNTYDDPRVFGLPVSLVPPSGPPMWDVSLNRLANAFLFNLLNRKVLLSRGASLEGLLALAAVAWILVRWYARTLAALQDRATVAENDVSMAIRLVDRYYSGHQPRFLQCFHSRLQAKLIVKLLFRSTSSPGNS